MRPVTPRVFFIAETVMPDEGGEIDAYLASIDAGDWGTDAQGSGEALVEIAGRLCYRSWKPGLNANVTRVREGNREYVANLLAQRHGAVLEHVSATFLFADVSRVLTHELVRHRIGVGISQESLRFVRLTDLPFWMPAVFAEDPDLARRARVAARNRALLERLEEHQRYLAEEYRLDDTGTSFHFKKRLTSAMRRFAPMGTATAILWTANLRTLRYVIEQRTSPAAEEEIRLVFDRVAQICQERWPAVFQDFTRQDCTRAEEDGTWTAEHPKV